jgi:hypothetical protein
MLQFYGGRGGVYKTKVKSVHLSPSLLPNKPQKFQYFLPFSDFLPFRATKKKTEEKKEISDFSCAFRRLLLNLSVFGYQQKKNITT